MKKIILKGIGIGIGIASLQIIFSYKPVIQYVWPGTRFDLTRSPFGRTKREERKIYVLAYT